VPAMRAGQWPVLARNDPLNIFGNQRQQTLLIATADRCKTPSQSGHSLVRSTKSLHFSC
jgi:hypothetical protein